MMNKQEIDAIESIINYTYINLLTLTNTAFRRLVRFIVSNKTPKYFYVTNRMIYMYYQRDDGKHFAFGLSMNDIYWWNVEKQRVLELINSGINNEFVDDDEIDPEIKKWCYDRLFVVPYVITRA